MSDGVGGVELAAFADGERQLAAIARASAANTVASSLGRSTSAFTCPTISPPRSTRTARRRPDERSHPPHGSARAAASVRAAPRSVLVDGAVGAAADGRTPARRLGRAVASMWTPRRAAAAWRRFGSRQGRVLGPHFQCARRELLLQYLDALRHARHALLDLREHPLTLVGRQCVEGGAVGRQFVEQRPSYLAQVDANPLGIGGVRRHPQRAARPGVRPARWQRRAKRSGRPRRLARGRRQALRLGPGLRGPPPRTPVRRGAHAAAGSKAANLDVVDQLREVTERLIEIGRRRLHVGRRCLGRGWRGRGTGRGAEPAAPGPRPAPSAARAAPSALRLAD